MMLCSKLYSTRFNGLVFRRLRWVLMTAISVILRSRNRTGEININVSCNKSIQDSQFKNRLSYPMKAIITS